MKKTFAILESNTGFIWGVVEADSAFEACSVIDAETGADRGDGKYVAVTQSDLNTTRGVYDVRFAPSIWLGALLDGQDSETIAVVEAMPRAGIYAWIGE